VVVREYLNREELFKKLTLVKVLALIQGAVSNKDELLYDETLAAVSRYVSDSDDGVALFFDALSRQPQIAQKIITLLETKAVNEFSPTALPELIAILILDPSLELPESVKHLITSKAGLVKNVLKNRFFNALKDANPTLAKTILDRFIAVYGKDDPDVRSLSVVLSKVEGSTSLSEFTGILVELSGKDPELRRSLATIALDLLHERVFKFIQAQKPIEAIHELSGIDIDRRTPRTHQLATLAVQSLTFSDFIALKDDTKSREFIKFLSAKDQNFRDACLITLEKEILSIFINQSFSEQIFNAGFELMSDVRPDPNALNDRIRIKCIEQAYESGDTSPIKFIKSDIRSSLTFVDEIKLIILYLKNNTIFILVTLLAVIGLIFGAIKKIKKLKASRSNFKSADYHKSNNNTSEELIEEPEEERPLFVKGRTTNSKYPAMYVELLAEFGLNPDSTIKEIKSAYRSRMKDIHPDLAGASSKHTSEFIHYQEAYERLIEFRKRLGLDT
jgi:hypothetical protein